MHRKALRTLGVFVLAGVVAVLAFSSLSTAAIKRIKDLIAPSGKSSVADVNAFDEWGPSTFSRDQVKSVTHVSTGHYCVFGVTARPSSSMAKVTIDDQHTDWDDLETLTPVVSWDRSSPDCGPTGFEIVTRVPDNLDFTDEVAFFVEMYVRGN
jgi:hypothetical protein